MGITDDDLQIGIPEGGIIRANFKLDTNGSANESNSNEWRMDT